MSKSKTQIIKQVGAGTYGKVYEITDTDGSIKALKRINWKDLNTIETDILMNLDSPHIIKAYRIEKDGFVMDLMKGDLADKIDTITPKELLSCFFQILDGLYCMHKSGFLHLDIKPDNWLFKYDDNNKLVCMLTDFGLSKHTIDAFSLQRIPDVMSTRGYEAPEISETKYLDSRADVYSVAVGMHKIFNGSSTLKIKYYDDFKKKKDYFYKEIIKFNSKFKRDRDKITYDDVENLSRILAWMFSPVLLRPNTRDLMTDKYIENNFTEERCILTKSKVYYVPFINHFTFDAIRKIEKNLYDYDIEYFFQAVEIFLMIESIEHKLYNEKEEDRIVKIACQLSISYIEDRSIKLPKDDIVFTALNLSGRINKSRIMQEAEYLEDLAILKFHLMKSESLLHIFNLINLGDLFKLFREKYKYKYNKINSYITLRNFDKKTEYLSIEMLNPELYLHEGIIKETGKNINEYREKQFKDIISSFSSLEGEIKNMLKGEYTETENNYKIEKIKNNKINIFDFFEERLDFKVHRVKGGLKKDLKTGCNLVNDDYLVVMDKVGKNKKNYVFYSIGTMGTIAKNYDFSKYKDFIFYKLDIHKYERFVIICYLFNKYEYFIEPMLEHNDYLISLMTKLYNE